MTGEFQGRAAVRRQLAAVRSKWLICVAGTGGALVVIGVVALAMTALGMFLGNRAGIYLGGWAERLGGAVLICIGLKILF